MRSGRRALFISRETGPIRIRRSRSCLPNSAAAASRSMCSILREEGSRKSCRKSSRLILLLPPSMKQYLLSFHPTAKESIMFMKSLTRILAFVIPFIPAVALANASVDAPAPGFAVTAADGKTVNLNAYKGKTVVLEWTNHDCPFVKKHYESGNMQRLQKDAAAKGVVWLQVISSAPGKQGYLDAAAATKMNADRNAVPASVLLDADGKMGQAYGAQTTPHMYIIDGKGTLVYKGGIDSISTANKEDIAKAEDYVGGALKSLAAGQKIANNSTKPYGCSIKYAN